MNTDVDTVTITVEFLGFLNNIFKSCLILPVIYSSLYTLPLPWQYGQGCNNTSSSIDLVFFLVISTRPKDVISIAVALILSFESSSLNTSINLLICSSSSISMKSTTIIPPIFLNLNCLAISFAAIIFVSNNVSLSCFWPMYFPVLTSITVKASVLSMIRFAPLDNITFLSSKLSICDVK